MKTSINATRGKPSFEQLALCDEMYNAPLENFIAEDGSDVRNYGGADGIPEMKRIFAEMLGVDTGEVIVGGNSSLNLMFDFVAGMILSGKWDASRAKFICPAPGYDRHFSVCEYFGIKMLRVPMTPNGPDIAATEELARDPDVVGIWCVPIFSNPQGYIYSDETVRRLAKMQATHPHFRIMWDNAYPVHVFSDATPIQAKILQECRDAGDESRPVLFTSFSKISYAGAGVTCMAAAGETSNLIRRRIAMQTIGPDKVNQLRHARYFKNLAGVEAHMKKHAEILRPKFELAKATFTREFVGTGATFTTPRGGYFISVDTPPNCAKRVWQLCKDAGVLMTDPGATFPYGIDPHDTNLRFAPTFLSMDELKQTLEVFCAAMAKVAPPR
ncbi:MAG: aminotransferase class I/II-fold pyridoxal phosphate-dependent enzyme [Defluviitaleaceae bacterium]|nr:aminotransferase class I/II-fold pyridoxal phosphate-dependent enzyme [Defluviitaleaceae bacterium]